MKISCDPRLTFSYGKMQSYLIIECKYPKIATKICKNGCLSCLIFVPKNGVFCIWDRPDFLKILMVAFLTAKYTDM